MTWLEIAELMVRNHQPGEWDQDNPDDVNALDEMACGNHGPVPADDHPWWNPIGY